MRILYGVQGTGNGHTSRARILAAEFTNTSLVVDYLFSGRDKSTYFDMDIFGDATYKKGLTLVINDGQMNLIRTGLQNDLITFIKDVRQLDLSSYDLVISDYEPITAWASLLRGKRCIGIGNQHSYNYDIPVMGDNIITRMVMKYFSPVSQGIGLHWDSFGQPIFPPILGELNPLPIEDNKIVVYLPVENPRKIHELLSQFGEYDFIVYGPDSGLTSSNIHYRLPSVVGFKLDLRSCDGVICNAGFELISEALQLGKKILTKPIAGQMEQESNAMALDKLGYATTMLTLDDEIVSDWLTTKSLKLVHYPNMGKHICDWVVAGANDAPDLNIWNKS